MNPRYVVTGTDTSIGKTIFSAALAAALGAVYWKPVQSGLDDETDSQAVLRLVGLGRERILPEAYRLKTPASPQLSARLDGVAIDPARLVPTETDAPLVIEGAGAFWCRLRMTCSLPTFSRNGRFLPFFAPARLSVRSTIRCSPSRR